MLSTAAAPQIKRNAMNEGTLTSFACSTAAARQLLTSASLSAHLLRLTCRSPRTASLSRSMACSSSARTEDPLREIILGSLYIEHYIV